MVQRSRKHIRSRREQSHPSQPPLLAALIVGLSKLVLRAIKRFWPQKPPAPYYIELPRARASNLAVSTPPAVAANLPARGVAPSPALPAVPLPREPFEPMPYCRTTSLLSKGERAFWYPLYRAVKGEYRIFCKIRLADVVCCPPKHPDERRWFKKIRGYHVDFVICEPRSTAPLLVIELDDRRHRLRKHRERDDFKDRVLRAAGMPVYRVNAQQAYDPVELRKEIERALRR